MNRAGCLVGAGILMGAMAGPVEALVVRYEINGKVYAYETTDLQQVERAQQRIGVANAAYAAKARADAELVSNPLLKVLGSRAQWEAAAAQARLQQVTSQQEPPPPATSPVTTSPVTTRASAKLQPTREVASANSKRPLPKLKTGPNRALAREGARSLVNAGPQEPKAAGEQSSVSTPTADAMLSPPPKSSGRHGAQRPALKSVTLDLSSGIKTVQLTDGTIHEEALDSSTLSKLGSVEPATESLTSFVEQVRATRSEDSTAAARPPGKGPATN